MRILTAALAALLFLGGLGAARADELKVGDPAPAIKVIGTDGKMHSLRDAVGKSWTVLAWYPKAATSGCTAECRALSDASDKIKGYNVVLYGASVDQPADNTTFRDHNKYTFTLLSDPQRKLAKTMGVLMPIGFASRWTFVIDDKGVIRAIDRNVHPASAGDDLIKTLDSLKVPHK